MASNITGSTTFVEKLVQTKNNNCSNNNYNNISININIKAPHHWPIVKGMHLSLVNSPHKVSVLWMLWQVMILSCQQILMKNMIKISWKCIPRRVVYDKTAMFACLVPQHSLPCWHWNISRIMSVPLLLMLWHHASPDYLQPRCLEWWIIRIHYTLMW